MLQLIHIKILQLKINFERNKKYMRKNKFLTAVCMLSAFVGSNLHAKTSKTKKVDKSKTSHKPVKNRKSHSGSNTGIYAVSSKNKNELIETKMSELTPERKPIEADIAHTKAEWLEGIPPVRQKRSAMSSLKSETFPVKS